MITVSYGFETRPAFVPLDLASEPSGNVAFSLPFLLCYPTGLHAGFPLLSSPLHTFTCQPQDRPLVSFGIQFEGVLFTQLLYSALIIVDLILNTETSSSRGLEFSWNSSDFILVYCWLPSARLILGSWQMFIESII